MKTILTLILAAAPAAAAMHGYAPGPEWTQITGDTSCINSFRAEVIRDAEEWKTLWKEHTCGTKEAPPAPRFDQAGERIIAVFLGWRPGAGYKVALEMQPSDKELQVAYREQTPQKGKAYAGLMTQPYIIKKVAGDYAAIRFVTKPIPDRWRSQAEPRVLHGTSGEEAAQALQESGMLADLDALKDALSPAVLFDGAGNRRTASVAPVSGDLIGARQTLLDKIFAGLPPPPGKKNNQGQERQGGKKLPPPPGKGTGGKKLPPPPQEGKKLPPPPGVRHPQPEYPGGPLPGHDRRLEEAERTFWTGGMDYVGFWRGNTYYKTGQATLTRGPGDEGETFSAMLESVRVRKYILFYYNKEDGKYYWAPQEKVLDARSRKLVVEFTNDHEKPLIPWENESFIFTLEGNTMSLQSQAGSYRYEVLFTADPASPGTVTAHMTAGEKLRTAPDAHGVSAGIQAADGGIKLVISDKWAQYYQGETLEISYVIRRDDGKWYRRDDIVQQATSRSPLQVPAAPRHEHGITGGYASKAGKFYLESWSFRRARSRISTGSWIPKGEGNSITK